MSSMPTKEFYFDQIEHEFATAREAVRIGNDGQARVCARRAVGQAITWFLLKFPHNGWGTDAMGQIKKLQEDNSFPQEVRSASERLTTKITQQFTSPFSTDPLDDAAIIIEHIKKIMEPKDEH